MVPVLTQFLARNGKSRSGEELFSKYFVNVNVILNFQKKKQKKKKYIPLKPIPKNTFFVADVSINWATDRMWQTKLLDTWTVNKINKLRSPEKC